MSVRLRFKIKKFISKLTFHSVGIILAIAFGYPVVWIFYSGFKTYGEIFASPWPTLNPTLDNFIAVWEIMNYPRLLANNIIVMVGATVPCTLVSAMAGYAFARLDFRGKYFFFLLIISGILIPMQVTIIPLFLMLKQMYLVNTYGGLIFPLIARWLPTGTFILTGFYKGIPIELEESARLDGASTLTIFSRIMLPLSKTILTTVAILVGLQTWAEFLLPIVVARDESLYTLGLGLMAFKRGYYFTDWNYVYAGLSISVLPTILLYAVLHRTFTAGITMGAVKG